MTRHRPILLLAALLLAACQASPGSVAIKRPRPPAAAGPVAVAPDPVGPAVYTPPAAAPGGQARALVETSGTGTLTGTVTLNAVSNTYFENSAANFRLLAMPAGRALVTLSSLEEELFGKNGTAITATSGLDGTFSLTGSAPSARSYVVNAVLAGNHRLSALVLAGQGTVTVDEATTMVAETARWQVTSEPQEDGRKSLSDLTPTLLETLTTQTRALLTPGDFASSGDVPSLPALKTGNGLALRNQYMRTFGTRVLRPDAATTNPAVVAANALSDGWASLLGYRPLAIAAMPTPGFTLLDATDVVADHRGHLFLGGSGHIKLFANIPRAGLWAQTGAMAAGQFYTVAGSAATASTFLASYTPTEAASVTNPGAAPLLSTGFPMPQPHKMLLERVGQTDESHLFFTVRSGHRVMLIPGADFTRFGRQFQAGRLYTVGGTGTWEAWGEVVQPDDQTTPEVDEEQRDYLLGDDGPAHEAPIVFPQGLDDDSSGNLYVSDSGYLGVPYYDLYPDATVTAPYTDPRAAAGLTMHTYHNSIRLIRADDGKIFTLRLTRNGVPHPVSAQDLRVHESAAGNHLYVTDTMAHQVFRIRLPDDLSTLDTVVPESFEIENVLGRFETAGYIDTTVTGASYPTLGSVGRGLPRPHVLLTSPLSVTFDDEGNLLVSDYYRIHLIKADALGALASDTRVYPLAGAFDGYLDGDSRFVTVRPRYMHYDGYRRTVFFPDATRNRIYMLHTARGTL